MNVYVALFSYGDRLQRKICIWLQRKRQRRAWTSKTSRCFMIWIKVFQLCLKFWIDLSSAAKAPWLRLQEAPLWEPCETRSNHLPWIWRWGCGALASAAAGTSWMARPLTLLEPLMVTLMLHKVWFWQTCTPSSNKMLRISTLQISTKMFHPFDLPDGLDMRSSSILHMSEVGLSSASCCVPPACGWLVNSGGFVSCHILQCFSMAGRSWLWLEWQTCHFSRRSGSILDCFSVSPDLLGNLGNHHFYPNGLRHTTDWLQIGNLTILITNIISTNFIRLGPAFGA